VAGPDHARLRQSELESVRASLVPAGASLRCRPGPESSCLRSVAGLGETGRVLLIALANGGNSELGFRPLDDGTLREDARYDVTVGRETGQVRILSFVAQEAGG
jgi:hypothetical protein